MDRDAVLATLRSHEPELKAAGVVSMAVFGSVALGEAGPESDVDLLVRLSEEASEGGFAYFARLDAITRQLEAWLGRPVDVITEPIRKDSLRRIIEKEAAFAF